jgi:hypothetical protein
MPAIHRRRLPAAATGFASARRLGAARRAAGGIGPLAVGA